MPLKNKEERLAYQRRYYKRRKDAQPEYLVARNRKNNKRYNLRNREIINEFKKGGCCLCPEKDVVCLDAHHVNADEKEYAIGKMGFYSEDKLRRELDKCICVCSNCHRKIHNTA